MTIVRVPSAGVPGVPPFAIALPGDWSMSPTSGAVAQAQRDDRPAWSVVITAVRVDVDDDLRSIAVRSFARQRSQHPSATIRSQRTGRFGDRLTYLREVAVPVTDDGPFVQLQAMFFAPGDDLPVRDAFSLVASCPDGDLGELGPLVVDMVASWTFAD